MITDILTKKPFARITPAGYLAGKVTNDIRKAQPQREQTQWQIVSQSDFVREFYPTGHKINSPEFYPNRIKYDEEKKRFFEEKVFRASFPFQMIITAQQLVHLCGNDIRFEPTDTKDDEAKNQLFLQFQQGWLDKKMEVTFYELAKSVKITGDGAVVFYLKNGKLYTKNLSFLDGDTLFPHYDTITGEIDAFARKYTEYDEQGKETITWVEVWDNKYMHLYRQEQQGIQAAVSKIKQLFGMEGYTLVDKKQHNFNKCPVVYMRDKHGPCWTFSQDNIDKYELAISHLCQNNMAYAFPIMILKGEDVKIEGDMYGAVKAITMGQDDSASFMSRPESPEAFRLQIETLLKMIFMGSFAVVPPDVKSGDLPGVSIKLIYSPSVDKAMLDAKEFDTAIDGMKQLFIYGYGIETGKATQFATLSIFSFIEPYIHQNTAELINNLVQSVNSGILSKQTASTLTTFDKNNEFDRIIKEAKEEQEADLLYNSIPTMQQQTAAEEEDDDTIKQQTDNNNQQ